MQVFLGQVFSRVASLTQTSNAVLIAGPTASGKSALALALAEKRGGIVINTDSMQVYRDLRILTARPTVEEEARVPHRLYGHVDAGMNFSAGAWIADAATVLAQARAQGWNATASKPYMRNLRGAMPRPPNASSRATARASPVRLR